MGVRIRVLVAAGVFALTCCGCQKAPQQASKESPDTAEAAKADSRAAAGAKSKTRVTRASDGEKATSKHEHDTASNEKKARVDTRSGVLTEADNGMEFDFRPGQIITVSLDSNRSSGLSWALIGSSGGVIVPEGTASYAVRTGKTAGGTETWRFRAAKPGSQTVKLEYRRKWAQSMPERTFRFSAHVR